RNACQWIEQNTPTAAIFLTPRGQQTFKWYANRAEVVAVKDVPQDARGIVQWRDRLREVYIPPVSEFGFAVLSESQIKQLANKYGASYVIVDKHRYSRAMALPLVYPTAGNENESFAVYRIP
ncbi:MAG TPA: DUF6798 domain-containing protein, partial [Pirellulaceae bacterium]|nr:DUF6798 domain-containing protein [Pirellulaceae bacterium]